MSGVSLSSDFISGFCGETDEDHQQTLSLIREVDYNVGFLFSYSMRKVSTAQTCSDITSVEREQFFSAGLFIFRKHKRSTGYKTTCQRR